jgi:hypothetical protein
MAKDPLKSPSDYEDPDEAVLASAEWIVVVPQHVWTARTRLM